MGRCIDPADYSSAPAYELLEAAAMGRIGLDHRLLHALLDKPGKSLPDILRFAREDRSGDRVVLEEDLIAVLRHIGSPEALPYYIELVRRARGEVSDELAEAFAAFPEMSSARLAELYGELKEDERGEVAFLLASLRVRDERIRRLLLERLDLDPGDAAFCLGLYGDQSVRADLERKLGEIRSDSPPDRWVRESIQNALSELDSPGPHNDHPAFDIWSLYPETAPPRVEILTEAERLAMLEARSEEFRLAAAESFFSEELTEAGRKRLYEVARNDESCAVRARAWEALGRAAADPEIGGALASLAADQSAPLEERAAAVVALAGNSDHPALRSWILALYEIPSARAKALQAMHLTGDRRFEPYFPAHLDDPDPDVRRRAIWGVGHFGLHTEAARLRALFDDEEFREDAIFAYALSVPAPISRGRARALLRKVEAEAGGLSLAEAEVVQWAIDERLTRLGLKPVFGEDSDPAPDEAEEDIQPAKIKVGRNDPCPCGSGKKYKKCCM